MNILTQQLASNAEESASAGEQLSIQAREMHDMIGQFRLTGDTEDASRRQGAYPENSPKSRKAPGAIRRDPKAFNPSAEDRVVLQDF